MMPANAVKSVAVIGNGLMGQGISQVFARAGKTVHLIGRNPASLDKAMAAINTNFGAFVGRGLTTEADASAALARIIPGTDYNAAGRADHVIEAVPAVRRRGRRSRRRLLRP